MKKAILGIILATIAMFGTVNVAQAADKTYTFEASDTIVITASRKSDSHKYDVYTKKKVKMVKTGKAEHMA